MGWWWPSEQPPPQLYTNNGHKIRSYASSGCVLSVTRSGRVHQSSGVQSPTMESKPYLHRTQHYLRSNQLQADNIWGVPPSSPINGVLASMKLYDLINAPHCLRGEGGIITLHPMNVEACRRRAMADAASSSLVIIVVRWRWRQWRRRRSRIVVFSAGVDDDADDASSSSPSSSSSSAAAAAAAE